MRMSAVLRSPVLAWVCQTLVAALLMLYSEMASWATPVAAMAEIPGTRAVATNANPYAISLFRCIYVSIPASERTPDSAREQNHHLHPR